MHDGGDQGGVRLALCECLFDMVNGAGAICGMVDLSPGWKVEFDQPVQHQAVDRRHVLDVDRIRRRIEVMQRAEHPAQAPAIGFGGRHQRIEHHHITLAGRPVQRPLEDLAVDLLAGRAVRTLWDGPAAAGRLEGNPVRADLELARKGVTRYSIVTADDASPVDRYAAQQLSLYLEQMTGATFAVVPEEA